MLNEDANFEVISETADALGLLQKQIGMSAELIMIDWDLPGLPLPYLMRLLRHEQPSFLIVEMGSHQGNFQQVFDNGVDVFIGKTQPPEAIRFTLPALITGNLNKARNHGFV